MPTLTAFVSAAETDWSVRWERDGQPLGVPFPLSAETVRTNDLLGQLFDADRGRKMFRVAVSGVPLLGRDLYDALCRPAWGDAAPPQGPAELHIRSDIADVLNLPWELLPLGAGGKPVGTDPNWCVYRVPVEPQPAANDALPPGPLRVLFMAADAKGTQSLDYEKEEEAVLRAVGAAGNVIPFVAEMGSIVKLGVQVEKFTPHVVHLSGHGNVEDGTALFFFEDERGDKDPKPAADLVDAFAAHRVRLVFVSGCKSAQADVAGMCQALVAAGIPLALGWAESVADDAATRFAETLYARLAVGDGVAAAVARARARIEADGRSVVAGVEQQDMTFVLPHLYAARPGVGLYDRTKTEEYKGAKQGLRI